MTEPPARRRFPSAPCASRYRRRCGPRPSRSYYRPHKKLFLLKNPPILILDETTSSLDAETEHAIQQSLVELSEGRTTLIIAHRLGTIRRADRIVVVDENGVAEQGRHEELIGARGVYHRLYEAQGRV